MSLSQIDLNADLGEFENDYQDLLKVVSSANISCGAHAGGGELMQKTIAAALAKNVNIGAHPSYPDRAGFGRVSMRANYSFASLLEILQEQVHILSSELLSQGGSLSHIKAHGALYNDAMIYQDTAEVLCQLASELGLPLFGLPKSKLEQVASSQAVSFIAEGFVDRRFTSEGTLVPRTATGAVLSSEEALAQVAQIVNEGSVTALSGEKLSFKFRTLCVHGDTQDAFKMAKAVRALLTELSVQIIAVGNDAH